LPKDQRVKWRGDSALSDGKSQNVYIHMWHEIKFTILEYVIELSFAWGSIWLKYTLKYICIIPYYKVSYFN
jgi:hypothetical protein